jgi:methylglyoxal/glyoxal reductase
MIQLWHRGKARAIGLSNYSVSQINDLYRNSDVISAVNQVEFHPFLYQKELLRSCKNNKIQPEAYSSLTRAKRLNDPKYGRADKEIWQNTCAGSNMSELSA